MTLARTLLKLWRLRLWVGLGVLLGGVAAVGSVSASHSTVYATASTQMVVDSQYSALANASVDLTGYVARANVFARMMTSAAALQYIGKAAGINGNLIDANGPIEINGSQPATHAPVNIVGGKDLPAPTIYQLSFVQNPALPTVAVYAKAPTTAQAIALADGAVTGFANFVNQLGANNIPQGQRVEVRQLGQATGGMVDAGASKKIAVLVFIGVVAVWCWIVLFVRHLLANVRAAKRGGADDLFPVAEEALPAFATPAITDDFPRFAPPADAPDADVDTNTGVNGAPLPRGLVTTRVQSRP